MTTPRRTSPAEPLLTDLQQAILVCVAGQTESIALQQIEEGLQNRINHGINRNINRRTLQRQLATLLQAGLLTRVGRGPAVRYRSAAFEYGRPSRPRHGLLREQETHPYRADDAPEAQQAHQVPPTPRGRADNTADPQIPLSAASKKQQAYVMQALKQRRKVSHQTGFLETYKPNRTAYLPQALRDELRALGQGSEFRQPAGTHARKVANRLLIDLSWNSSRLEGNMYSLLETERLISAGLAAEKKDLIDTQMILNHKSAIEFLIESAADIAFDRYTLLNLHALLADNLLPDRQACGRLRRIPVGIGQSVYEPLQIPQQIEAAFELFLKKAEAISDPFEQAFFAMVHLPYLQAFEDVNKRVSRLAANIPLIRHNLAPLSFIGMPQRTYINGILAVYELRSIDLLRDVFVWAYRQSCARYSSVRQQLGEPDAFRLRYRLAIHEVVADAVRRRLEKADAVRSVAAYAKANIASMDVQRFIEAAETELLSLHLGNIARFRLRPSEFEAWQQHWNGR